MTSSFGVQTVLKTASKHYKIAVNSFKKRVLEIPNVTETFYYPRLVRHSKSGRQTSLHLVFAQFIKIISHYKKIGYNINVLQQIACLVVNPITIGNFAFLFNCTPVGRTSDSMTVST